MDAVKFTKQWQAASIGMFSASAVNEAQRLMRIPLPPLERDLPESPEASAKPMPCNSKRKR